MALITTRKMNEDDAQAVAVLSAQLGYPVSKIELKNRFLRIAATIGNVLFVALDDEQTVIGWMHVHTVDRLEVGRYAEIGGIVVDAAMRGKGVGRALMRCAGAWARDCGYDRVKLSSGAHRIEAHAFYEHIGYSNIRTSYRFEKILKA
jgi:GNAT superfamily N-acetyltransferase